MSRFPPKRLGSIVLPLLGFLLVGSAAVFAAEIQGDVRDQEGRPLAGAFVRATHQDLGMARTVFTREQGGFLLADLPPGPYRVEAWRGDSSREDVSVAAGSLASPLRLQLKVPVDPGTDVPSSTILQAIPDGVAKRRLKIDCMGCHTFHPEILEEDGVRISRRQWIEAVDRMLAFAGHDTDFPIIAPDRVGAATADALTPHLGGPFGPRPHYEPPAPVTGEVVHAVFTEYRLPEEYDLPHDVMVDARGRPVVTGMFSGQMLRLDPTTAQWKKLPIPVDNATPRALVIDKNGVWWVALGAPRKLARYNPRQGSWKVLDLGVYPHSVALDSSNRIWANDHFGKDPQWIVALDPGTEEVSRHQVPVNPMPDAVGGPIGYGLRVGPDDSVWGTELAGNRLVRFDPGSGAFRTWDLPVAWSGPRRLDVDPDGVVWIPEFAGNALTRFDPVTEGFERHEVPVPDALPYCARVHPLTGEIWVTLVGADAMARFLPRERRFVLIPMPSRVAMMRHLDFDRETGAVWTTYSSSPGVHPRVVKLELP